MYKAPMDPKPEGSRGTSNTCGLVKLGPLRVPCFAVLLVFGGPI